MDFKSFKENLRELDKLKEEIRKSDEPITKEQKQEASFIWIQFLLEGLEKSEREVYNFIGNVFEVESIDKLKLEELIDMVEEVVDDEEQLKDFTNFFSKASNLMAKLLG
jgi:hypothetical protein